MRLNSALSYNMQFLGFLVLLYSNFILFYFKICLFYDSSCHLFDFSLFFEILCFDIYKKKANATAK